MNDAKLVWQALANSGWVRWSFVSETDQGENPWKVLKKLQNAEQQVGHWKVRSQPLLF
jgi:hypothetical protein